MFYYFVSYSYIHMLDLAYSHVHASNENFILTFIEIYDKNYLHGLHSRVHLEGN